MLQSAVVSAQRLRLHDSHFTGLAYDGEVIKTFSAFCMLPDLSLLLDAVLHFPAEQTRSIDHASSHQGEFVQHILDQIQADVFEAFDPSLGPDQLLFQDTALLADFNDLLFDLGDPQGEVSDSASCVGWLVGLTCASFR